MSTEKSESSFDEFNVHTTAIPLRGLTQRDPEGMRISPSGRAETNAAASDWILTAARATFGGVTKCGIQWASNEETRTLAGRFVHPETVGATPIRRSPKSENVVLYMNNVFIDKPGLKPNQSAWVSMGTRTDSAAPWFTVHLNLALTTARRKARAKSGAEPAAKESTSAGAAVGQTAAGTEGTAAGAKPQ
jgi:hypothetical protein